MFYFPQMDALLVGEGSLGFARSVGPHQRLQDKTEQRQAKRERTGKPTAKQVHDRDENSKQRKRRKYSRMQCTWIKCRDGIFNDVAVGWKRRAEKPPLRDDRKWRTTEPVRDENALLLRPGERLLKLLRHPGLKPAKSITTLLQSPKK